MTIHQSGLICPGHVSLLHFVSHLFIVVRVQSTFVSGRVDSSNSVNTYRRLYKMCSNFCTVFLRVSTAASMQLTEKYPLVVSKLKSTYPRRTLALVHGRSYECAWDEIIFKKNQIKRVNCNVVHKTVMSKPEELEDRRYASFTHVISFRLDGLISFVPHT